MSPFYSEYYIENSLEYCFFLQLHPANKITNYNEVDGTLDYTMPVATEVDLQVEQSDKVFERSDQDGELYAKPTIGIIYPPPEVRSIFSTRETQWQIKS